jgi:Holliday junction resolvasome RuvABC endonuclease subunit
VNLGKTDGARFSKVLALTSSLIADHKPDMVVAEAAIGGPQSSQFLVGLVACVQGCATIRAVRFETCHLGSIRKHFVGKALTVKDYPHLNKTAAKKAIKQEVIKRCEMLGWNPADDNAADALALLDYALATYGNHQARVAGGLV